MKEIPLTNGLVALVDDEDFERVSSLKWRAAKFGHTWYGIRTVVIAGTKTSLLLHRFILGESAGADIDHKDRNGLNNRRGNLRFCTHAQNMRNRVTPQRGLPKGVYRHGNRFRSIVTFGARIDLGSYRSPFEAAKAYDLAALRLYGEFARTNFPPEYYENPFISNPDPNAAVA